MHVGSRVIDIMYRLIVVVAVAAAFPAGAQASRAADNIVLNLVTLASPTARIAEPALVSPADLSDTSEDLSGQKEFTADASGPTVPRDAEDPVEGDGASKETSNSDAVKPDEARQHEEAARAALTKEDFEVADAEVLAAEGAGAQVSELRHQIDAARTLAISRHKDRARTFIKANDPDAALAEVLFAEALLGGGPVALMDLRDAIAKTPKAKKRAAEKAHEARRAEAEARKAEAKRRQQATRNARSQALVTLCDLAAEMQRDLQELRMAQTSECGGSSMSPDAMPCFQEYSNAMRRVSSRYDTRMSRFRASAVNQIGRAVTKNDCCDALPSRYRSYGSNCVQVQ